MEIHLGMHKFKFNTKFLYMSFFGMTMAGLFIGGLFYGLYNAAKGSLLSAWKNNIIEAGSEVDYYLAAPTNAVEFSAVKINEMLLEDKPNEVVQDYLLDETEVYSSLIKGNHSGIYGYIRGEYLDGNGWVPDSDYDPLSRPWYTAAIEGQGRTMVTNPYLNLETRTMMISVSKLLNDGESVVAMDLFMVEIEDLLKRIVVQNSAEAALILDKNGIVIAHSDYLELGKDYNTDKGEIGQQLVDALINAVDGNVILTGKSKNFAAFFDRCNKGWYVILVINEKDAFRPLRRIYFIAGLALFVVLIIVFAAFNYMGYKQNEVEHLGREVLAVADIYISMLSIDVESDMISVIRKNSAIDRILGRNFGSFSLRIKDIAEQLCAERYVEMIKGFLDLSTLNERMENVNTISCEFVDAKNRWLRMRYISMKRDDEGKITQVLLAVESIDEDRKKQEQLRILSEMDRMTGIMNRGSGEQAIRDKLPDVDGGMFCLMDADKFKYVNDTFGHAVGDKVLIAIARALKESFRDSDVVFRLGGDEFAAFAADVKTQEIANMIVGRFFQKIDKIDIPEMGGHKISVSMGAALYNPDHHESFEKLYERADKGTYISKKSEGNIVTFIDEKAEN